jgi:hypothetical protein
MPIGADTPSRFDIAMLHKRDVDVINGVTPRAAGTSLTGSGSGSGMFYIRLRPSTAIGCGTKQ